MLAAALVLLLALAAAPVADEPAGTVGYFTLPVQMQCGNDRCVVEISGDTIVTFLEGTTDIVRLGGSTLGFGAGATDIVGFAFDGTNLDVTIASGVMTFGDGGTTNYSSVSATGALIGAGSATWTLNDSVELRFGTAGADGECASDGTNIDCTITALMTLGDGGTTNYTSVSSTGALLGAGSATWTLNDAVELRFGTAGADGECASDGTNIDCTITASMTLGDGGTTNYSALSSAGVLSMVGTARPTQEILIPAGEFVGNAGSAARGLIGSANAQGWALDAAADESISAMLVVPDNFAAVDVTCSIYWSTTATTEAQAWYFELITVPTAVGEDSGVAGNTDTGNDAIDAGSVADQLYEAAVTVAASTEWAAGDVVYLTVLRDADNGSDDLAADVSVQAVVCQYTASSLAQ